MESGSSVTLPNSFTISNDFAPATTFTVSNATSGSGTELDPYIWTLPNVPYGTAVQFMETDGYEITGYTRTKTEAKVGTGSWTTVTATRAGSRLWLHRG